MAAAPTDKQTATASVPLAILHDAIGTVVTVELNTGDNYRGDVVSIDDNMCIELKAVTHTDAKGRAHAMNNVFLRGSNVVFFALPPALEHALAARAPRKSAVNSGTTRPAGGRPGDAVHKGKRPRE